MDTNILFFTKGQINQNIAATSFFCSVPLQAAVCQTIRKCTLFLNKTQTLFQKLTSMLSVVAGISDQILSKTGYKVV